MILKYAISGKCGKNTNNTILFSAKRLMWAFFQSYILYGKPTGANIYESIKTLAKTPNLLKNYDPHYASKKTNCILALCNDVLRQEYNMDVFTHMRFGSSKSIPNTYLATNKKDIISYSICLKNSLPTKSSKTAARGGFVAQLKFDPAGNHRLSLEDPDGLYNCSIEDVLCQRNKDFEIVKNSFIKNKKHKEKNINGNKVYCLSYQNEEVEFEFGVADNFNISVEDDKLLKNEMLLNGLYVNVISGFNEI